MVANQHTSVGKMRGRPRYCGVQQRERREERKSADHRLNTLVVRSALGRWFT